MVTNKQCFRVCCQLAPQEKYKEKRKLVGKLSLQKTGRRLNKQVALTVEKDKIVELAYLEEAIGGIKDVRICKPGADVQKWDTAVSTIVMSNFWFTLQLFFMYV